MTAEKPNGDFMGVVLDNCTTSLPLYFDAAKGGEHKVCIGNTRNGMSFLLDERQGKMLEDGSNASSDLDA